jgi:ABC-type transporter MlaC component
MANTIGMLISGLLAALVAIGPAVAGEAEEHAALVAVETLVGDAHAAMTSSELDETVRRARLKQVVAVAFAFDIWERFLVGDRNLTPAQLDEFRGLLPDFLAQLYATQFGKGLEGAPAISATRAVRDDVMVAAAIPRASGKSLPVEYRVRNFGERGSLVIDVMVGGISFLVLKRDEFKGLIDGRGIDGLLEFMRGGAS